jgi:hypothetical protein
MERTERFRGRLMAGDKVLIPTVEGLLKSHARGGGAVGEWSGYFEYPAEMKDSLVAGNRYRLVLIDGRSGTISLRHNELDPLERTMVNFSGTGSYRH